MQNPIDQSAQSTLAQYANYAEKELLSRGDIASCFASVLSRLSRSAKFSIGCRALLIFAAVASIAWLSYSSAIRDDLTFLICFSPVFLSVLWRLSSLSKNVWQAITKVETVAELWREFESDVDRSIDHGECLSHTPADLIAG